MGDIVTIVSEAVVLPSGVETTEDLSILEILSEAVTCAVDIDNVNVDRIATQLFSNLPRITIEKKKTSKMQSKNVDNFGLAGVMLKSAYQNLLYNILQKYQGSQNHLLLVSIPLFLVLSTDHHVNSTCSSPSSWFDMFL